MYSRSVFLILEVFMLGTLSLCAQLSITTKNEINKGNSVFHTKNENKDVLRPRVLQKYPLSSTPLPKNNLTEFVKHMEKLGFGVVQIISKMTVKDILRIKKNATIISNKAANEFVEEVENHMKYVNSIQGFIDEEFMFFNILDSVNRYIYNNEWHLVSKLIQYEKPIMSDRHMQNITDLLDDANNALRRNVSKHICQSYKICKPYPAFSDYYETFLGYMLRLPKDYVRKLFVLLKEMLEQSNLFTALFPDATVRTNILKLFEKFNNNPDIIEKLVLIRGTLNQKYQISRVDDLKSGQKLQAWRALIDVIDKTFNYGCSDCLSFDFDATTHIIMSWAIYTGTLDESIILDVVTKVLKAFISSKIVEKRALVDILMSENTQLQRESYKYLSELKSGYKGVYY